MGAHLAKTFLSFNFWVKIVRAGLDDVNTMRKIIRCKSGVLLNQAYHSNHNLSGILKPMNFVYHCIQSSATSLRQYKILNFMHMNAQMFTGWWCK